MYMDKVENTLFIIVITLCILMAILTLILLIREIGSLPLKKLHNRPPKKGYQYTIKLTLFPEEKRIINIYSCYGKYHTHDLFHTLCIKDKNFIMIQTEEDEKVYAVDRILKIEMEKVKYRLAKEEEV